MGCHQVLELKKKTVSEVESQKLSGKERVPDAVLG